MQTAERILVFGATSAICHALLKRYAARGAVLFLVARSDSKLQAIADDLVARGARVAAAIAYDFNDWSRHEDTLSAAVECLGAIDIALVAHGSLPASGDKTGAAIKTCMDDNLTTTAIIVETCSSRLELQGRGTLAVLSSVAGDRGRKSNYIYGAAKAGVDTLLQGLQGRFSGSAVRVVNIKPGMILTPMTAGMRHGALWAEPDDIAPAIQRAIEQGRKVCYVPGYWRLIMLVIRCLPTKLLAKLPV